MGVGSILSGFGSKVGPFAKKVGSFAKKVRNKAKKKSTEKVSKKSSEATKPKESAKEKESPLKEAKEEAKEEEPKESAKEKESPLEEAKEEEPKESAKEKESPLEEAKEEEPKEKKKGIFSSFGSALSSHVEENWEINLFFIIVWIVHLIDCMMSFNGGFRWLAYLVALPFLGFFLVHRDPSANIGSLSALKHFGKSFALSIIALLIPILLSKGLSLAGAGRELNNLILVMFPFYPLWFILVEPISPLIKTIRSWTFGFWSIIGFMALFAVAHAGNLQDIPMLQGEHQTNILGAMNSLINLVKNVTGGFIEKLGKLCFCGATSSFKKMMSYAAGEEYYEGEEEQTKEDYGVFIEDLEPSSANIQEGDQINIWGFVRVQMAEEQDREVELECNSENKENPGTYIQGDINPQKFLSIGNDYKDLSCRFDENAFKEGYRKINFLVKYDFSTSSRIKMYFTDQERKDTMRREGIDILDEYGITDKNPIAIYTNGPIHLGISSPPMPIGLEETSSENGPTIGFTLEMKWEGKIKKINDLKLYLPKGLELNSKSCDYEFSTPKEEDSFYVYQINKQINPEGIGDYLTLKCRTKIKDKNLLIGDVPVSTKYVKVFANYEFKHEESIGIDIQEKEE